MHLLNQNKLKLFEVILEIWFEKLGNVKAAAFNSLPRDLKWWKIIEIKIQGVPKNMGIQWRIRYRLFK